MAKDKDEKLDYFKEDPENYYAMPCVGCVHREKDVNAKDCPCKKCFHYTE